MSWMLPPPEGFHVAARNPDGTLSGKVDPKEADARKKKFEDGMKKYEQRTRDAEQRLLRRAAGLEEKTEQPPPRDELALIELNLLADPGLLDGRGAGDGIRTLTNDQRRALRREQLNAKAQDARKTLNKIIAGEEDEDDHASEPSAIKAMLRSDDEDEDDGWVTDEELVDIEVGEVYEL